ncbi:MAG: methyltransferase domain-containing protein [Gammaproteobacteria bacterium]
MTHPDEAKWNARYREARPGTVEAAQVLRDYDHLLPAKAVALDLACGLGGNALFLARRGFEVWAWDISPVAIEKLRAAAAEARLNVTAEVRDVLRAPPEPDRFDVIVVSRFLERDLMPALLAALKPEGLLFYQTFTRERVDESGPGNDAYRLATNELLRLCDGLRVLLYREEGRVGDIGRGFRNEAMVVAQRIGG